MEIAGHLIGGIAILLFFLSYQVSEKKKLLVVQTVGTALFCIQYILIGAYSGFALNIVCVIRNILFYYRDKKVLSGVWLPILLAVVMGVLSLYSWDGYHSLLIAVGLMINTLCMGLCDAQNLRKSVLITCPMVLIYNVFELSYSGMINESISLISATIGILRYKKHP